MTRNTTSSARKERGEERNKAKWMKEAQKNRKRAEEAELRVVRLQQELAAASAANEEVAPQSSSLTDMAKEEDLPVSRAEFEMVRSELEQLRAAYVKATDVNKVVFHERSMLEAQLENVEENARQLKIDLSKARSAEAIARKLYKETIERAKEPNEITVQNCEPEVREPELVKTPHPFPDIRMNQSTAARNLSPVTPERLDFRMSSPEPAVKFPDTESLVSRKKKSFWEVVLDFFSGLLRKIFGASTMLRDYAA